MDAAELQDLMTRDEPLHPDLTGWMEDTDSWLGKVLKHPLVFQVPFMSNAMANKQYEAKKNMLAEYKRTKNWQGIIWVHERPHRLEALLSIKDEVSNEEFWDLVATVWIDSENIWQNYDLWQELLSDERPGREHLMDDEEREALAQLPETITIYRGCQLETNEEGFSWSTDRERAEWFAKRFHENRDGQPIVIVGEVQRDNVLAYFTGRGEDEILAHDHAVKIIRYEEV